MGYSYIFKPLRIYIDGKLASYLSVREIRRSVNGQKVDATEIALQVNRKPLREEVIGGFGFDGKKLPVCEVTTAQRRVLFAGVLTQKLPTLNRDAEQVDYLVRLENFLFGNPVGFYPDYLAKPPKGSAGGGQELSLYRSLEFNPEIDGRVRFNRDPASKPADTTKTHLFLEYDSTRTGKARATFGQEEEPKEWRLLDIVQYLCWALNPDQAFIRNPTLAELELAFGRLAKSKAEAVRDFRVRNGNYLPDVLDDLLNPRGYAWFVRHERLGRRKLAFFRRGEGTGGKLTIDMGKAGGVLEPTQHNCCGAGLRFDAAACVNRVRVLGSRMRVEVTVELVRAWPAEKDSLREDVPQLSKSEDNLQFDAVRDVWRKWALNESGDYTGLRTDIEGYFKLPDYIGQTGFDDAWVPRRREFLPTLTLGSDGKPIGQHGGCLIEYWTRGASGEEWRVLDSGGEMPVSLVEGECAIYFGGRLPPQEILHMGTEAKVRITCTLEMDLPLGHDHVGVSKSSPTETPILLALDMSDHFHSREVTKQSVLYAQVQDGTFKSDAVDDTERLKEYVERVLDAEDYGQVAGTLVLEGVDRWPVELGQPIELIEGRNLNLNGRNSAGIGADKPPKYPTVVGIAYDVAGQKTRLTLEHFRKHTLPEVT